MFKLDLFSSNLSAEVHQRAKKLQNAVQQIYNNVFQKNKHGLYHAIMTTRQKYQS